MMTDNSNSNTQTGVGASEQIDRIVGAFADAVRETVRENLLGRAVQAAAGQTPPQP